MNQHARNKIRSFVEGMLAEHDDRGGFDDGESLIKAGRLDSLAVVKLITFLEDEFGVDFGKVEFDPERLDSVAEIAAVVDESQRIG
jgi:acyl carrier protein